ncbi:flavin reductase family protein [Nesterenkonia alkaliphila]|uniref:Flavin reductase n=1 Tax=Nesterenkonia alkaliphila TaxID=1463631 RepID=A0A7K1UIN0_9MICC|nr:flavin reductase family protein [Nesterenkonia alkaliphila]MVT26319.1 flavin reductase [Nesterenkonia alkaliphila]GFZ88327.1 putative oxidoreductase [Nesterenkonia alkaliphila]
MSLSAATLAQPQTPADPLALRAAFAQFPQGVVVLGAEIDGAPEGLVASTFTVGVSLDPPLVSFAVQHTSSTWPRLRRAPQLGVSVLGEEQQGLCRQIAAKDRSQRFAGVEYSTDDAGALAIAHSPLHLRTRLYNQFPAGDHDVVLLEVLDLTVDEARPGLVFHQSTFKPLP